MNKLKHFDTKKEKTSKLSKSKTLQYSFALIIASIIQTWCASNTGWWNLPVTIVNHWRQVYPNRSQTKEKQDTQKRINKENQNIETLNKLISETLVKIQKAKTPEEKRELQKDLRFYISSLNDLTNSEKNIKSINKWDIQELWVQILNSNYNAPQMRNDKQRMESYKRAWVSYRYYDSHFFSKHFDKLDNIYYLWTRSKFNWILENGKEIDLRFWFWNHREDFSFLLENNKLIVKHKKTWEEKVIFLNKNRYNHSKRVNVTFWSWQNNQDGYEVNIPLHLSY